MPKTASRRKGKNLLLNKSIKRIWCLDAFPCLRSGQSLPQGGYEYAKRWLDMAFADSLHAPPAAAAATAPVTLEATDTAQSLSDLQPYVGKTIKVRGVLSEFKGDVQIVVKSLDQIQVVPWKRVACAKVLCLPKPTPRCLQRNRVSASYAAHTGRKEAADGLRKDPSAARKTSSTGVYAR